MEEKKQTKISLTTLFLILAIIAIIVMGIFIYNLYNEKTEANEKVLALQNRITDLDTTLNNIQQTINNVSQTNNTNTPSTSQTTNNLVGTYSVNISSFSTDDEENKDLNYGAYTFNFSLNGEVSFNEGWGTSGYGYYTIENNLVKCEFSKWESESGGYFVFNTEPIIITLTKQSENLLIANSVQGNGKVTELIKSSSETNFGWKDMNFTTDECLNGNAQFIK